MAPRLVFLKHFEKWWMVLHCCILLSIVPRYSYYVPALALGSDLADVQNIHELQQEETNAFS